MKYLSETEKAFLNSDLFQTTISILNDLIDNEKCEFDHHGHCQACGWTGEDLCPYERGKNLLENITNVMKQEKVKIFKKTLDKQ